jgi:hypothetical protein
MFGARGDGLTDDGAAINAAAGLLRSAAASQVPGINAFTRYLDGEFLAYRVTASRDFTAIRGRQEIEAYLQDTITPNAQYGTDTEMTLVNGDLAVEQGRYRIRNVRRGADVEEGKYLNVWRRSGTSWKLYRMIYNTDVEPRTEVSVEPAREQG